MAWRIRTRRRNPNGHPFETETLIIESTWQIKDSSFQDHARRDEMASRSFAAMGLVRRATFQNAVHEAASATRGFRAGKPSLGGADVRARNPRRRSERTKVPRFGILSCVRSGNPVCSLKEREKKSLTRDLVPFRFHRARTTSTPNACTRLKR